MEHIVEKTAVVENKPVQLTAKPELEKPMMKGGYSKPLPGANKAFEYKESQQKVKAEPKISKAKSHPVKS